MIKKLLIFIVLLVGGFFLLHSIIDADSNKPGSQGGKFTPSQEEGAKKDRAGGDRTQGVKPVIRIDPDRPQSYEPGGPWELPIRRDVQVSDGRIKQLLKYDMKSKDSYAEPNNKLVLVDVTVDFFDIVMDGPGDPYSKKIGTLLAKRARVELSQDESKVAVIAEDKLMEFEDVVFSSAPGEKHRFTVRLPRASVINTKALMHLWTPETETVEIHSEDGFHVTGAGFDAEFPTLRDEKGGSFEHVADRLAKITVLKDAVLVHQDTTLRSRGPLVIKEEATIGATVITMTDRVYLFTNRPGAKGDSRRKGKIQLEARGDFLRAVLIRGAGDTRFGGSSPRDSARVPDDSSKYQLQEMVLRGTPARLISAEGMDLTCRTLTMTPDNRGQPYWYIASGDAKHKPVLRHTVGGKVSEFHSSGRVHLVEVRKQHGFFLDAFGITGIPNDFDQMILFEGKSSLVSEEHELEIEASRGMTLLRSSRPELSDLFVLLGRGDVEVNSVEVRLRGNRGFTMHQVPTFGKRSGSGSESGRGVDVVRRLQLGPAQPDSSHVYQVRHLAKSDRGKGAGKKRKSRKGSNKRSPEPFDLTGSGTCSIHLRNEFIDELHLSSLAEDITASLGGEKGYIKQMRTLDAWFDETGKQKSFIGKGRRCLLHFVGGDGTADGFAEQIHQPQPDTVRLLGSPAEMRHSVHGRLRGREVLMHRLSDEDVSLRAFHDARLWSRPVAKQSGRFDKIDLRADEIRLEPFVMPPHIVGLHNSMMPSTLQRHLSDRHLFAKGNVRLDYEGLSGPSGRERGHARGRELILRTGRAGEIYTEGHLLGSPAHFTSVDARGRPTVAESHRLWFSRVKDLSFLVLHRVGEHMPILRLGSLDANGRMQMTCDGRIEVHPRTVKFHGAAHARSLDPRGVIDPAGYSVDAGRMEMGRSPKGTISSIDADQGVRFKWDGAFGSCDRLLVDVTRETLSARGLASPAVVTLNSERFTVRRLDYNYRTRMHRTWKGKAFTLK